MAMPIDLDLLVPVLSSDLTLGPEDSLKELNTSKPED